MLRIAVILPSLSNKAPIQVAKDLVAGMILYGINVEVFYFDEITEVDFACVTKKLKFCNRIEFEKFDIVHTHMLRPDAYVWFWRLFAKRGKTVFISTLHNIVEEDLYFQYGRITSFVFSRLWRLFWSAQDRLVVLSRDAKEYYFSFLSGREATVIHNGRALSLTMPLNDDDEKLILDLKSKYKLIGCCALLSHRKGIDQIIKVLPMCKDYALIILGDGKVRHELESLAATLGVTDRCKFLGFRKNAQDFLPFLDVYAMPSRSEGLPLALLEAAGNGLATVCSNIAPFREVFTSEEVSFFVLDDLTDLARAIRLAYESRVLLSIAIYKKYASCYTSEVMVKNYLNFFGDLGVYKK